MKKFHTGYYITLEGRMFSPEEYSEKLILDPGLKLIPENYRGHSWEVDWEFNDDWNGLEFILICKDSDIAQNVLFNIHCAASVIDGTLIFYGEPNYPKVFGTLKEFNLYDQFWEPLKATSNHTVPEYFSLAAKASKDIRVQNAIIKYKLSNDLYSQHYMDLSGITDWKTTDFSYIQMKFAYAIILAYAVIEELGLEIKASKDNPSILPNNEWNPKVLEDLMTRLKISGIDVEKGIWWLRRGEETVNEKKRLKIPITTELPEPVIFGDESIMSNYDDFIPLPDAINYISYLRSRIASHCVEERIMSLSVFDGGNA